MILTSEGKTNKIFTFPTCRQLFQLLNTFNQNILKKLFSSTVEQKQIWNFYPVWKVRIVLFQLALVMAKDNLNKVGMKNESEI